MSLRHLFQSASGLFLLALVCLSGCAQKQEQADPFLDHWQGEAQKSQGYSPSVKDLRPEPRVVMRQGETGQQVQKPLPGMPVTLKLHNVDVGIALRSLAAAAGVNVLLSPGVTGTVSLNVQKSPWRDVFQSLLLSNGLEYRWQGNILQVLTALEKRKEVELQTLDNQMSMQEATARQNAPLTVSVVSVRYADADALQQSLMKLLSTGQQTGQQPLIAVDVHSNALIVQASAEEQKRIIQLVDSLDRPRPQVHLKAYIVEATKESARELGTQWGGVWRSGSYNGGNHSWVGSGGASGTMGVDPVTGPLTGTNASGLGGAPMGLDYSSIASSKYGALGFMFGKVGGNMLEVQLNLMEKDGKISILSSPSLTTLDNKMAYTENGEKVPYVTTNTQGDREVKFEDAVLRLEMTPNVIDGDNLKLRVMVKKDEVDTSRSVDGNPFIIKKQTETTLIMGNKETVVISGLSKEKGTNTNAGVPGLKDLPGGKYAFGHESKGNTMEEVLIFITPEILPTRESVVVSPQARTTLPPEAWPSGRAAGPSAPSVAPTPVLDPATGTVMPSRVR